MFPYGSSCTLIGPRGCTWIQCSYSGRTRVGLGRVYGGCERVGTDDSTLHARLPTSSSWRPLHSQEPYPLSLPHSSRQCSPLCQHTPVHLRPRFPRSRPPNAPSNGVYGFSSFFCSLSSRFAIDMCRAGVIVNSPPYTRARVYSPSLPPSLSPSYYWRSSAGVFRYVCAAA